MIRRKLFIFLLLTPVKAFCQFSVAPPDSLHDDLGALLNTQVAVASLKEMSISESPAIITVLTNDDLNRFGIRYLSDINRLVPGFSFGCDVLGVVGLGIRNNWVHEGKVLIMLDGMELNEDLYANTQFGNHYSLEHIEKIEIIRGPGSVMYGGTAALAVINMISRSDRTAPVAGLTSTVGTSSGYATERGLNAYIRSGNDRKGFFINSRFSRDLRATGEYTDIQGGSFSMAAESGIENTMVNAALNHNGWKLQGMFDDYILESKDGYLEIYEKPVPVRFKTLMTKAEKRLHPSDKTELKPYAAFKYQTPWAVNYPDRETRDEFIRLYKLISGITATYSVNDYHSVEGGTEYWAETATVPEGAKPQFESSGGSFNHYNLSAFIQSTSRIQRWAFSAGARYNYNSSHFSAFVPRFSATKTWRWGYSKAIFSRSFRSPSIMNIEANGKIRPEFTTVMEFETGFAFQAFSVLSVNVFRSMIKNPITYYYDEASQSDMYINDGHSGTEGIEITFNHHFPKSQLILVASAVRPVKGYHHEFYSVKDKKNYLLGFAPMMASANYAHRFSEVFSAWAGISAEGAKYGITGQGDNDEAEYSRYRPQVFINTGIRLNPGHSKKWTVETSVINLLNSNIWFIQPYRSYHGALPGKNREYKLTVRYTLRQ